MDLSAVKPSEVRFEITHPGTGKGVGVFVSCVSIDDEKLKGIKNEISNARLKLERRGKTFTAQQLEENNNRLLFAAMTGWEWSGDMNFHSSKPQFNEENVLRVFDELPWFAEQVNAKVGETKDFFPT